MYESPIDIVVGEIHTAMIKERENQIYKAIQSYGVNVNREELIKALQYDRNQYDKGFRDGIKEFAERMKRLLNTEMLPLDSDNEWQKGYNIATIEAEEFVDLLAKEMVGDTDGKD